MNSRSFSVINVCAMNFKPLFNNVLIEPLEGEQKTASGIYIPETAQEKSKKGKVVAIGEGRYEDGKLIPVGVKIGDIAIWRYGGEEIKVDGKKLLVMKDTDLIGVIS